jgi:hypothetical protein
MLTRLLLPLACAAGVLAACATTPRPLTLERAPEPDAACVPETATRLPMKSSECAGFGLRFTKQQLNSTGQPYAQQELGSLNAAALSSAR